MSKNNSNPANTNSDADFSGEPETFSLNPGTETKMDSTEAKAAPAPKSPAKPEPAEKPAKGKIGVKEPAGEEKMFDRKKLAFDRRLQMRTSMFDETTVERYKEVAKENPKAFPGLKVMEIPAKEAEELELDSPYVVWDGFQRGEAYNRLKMDKVPVVLAKGSFALARLLALQANHDAALPRNSADLRRAFHELIGDEKMLAKVMAWGKGNGGATRALAAAAGISKSLVSKILLSMGKTTRGTQIVDAPGGAKGSTSASGGPHDRGRDPVGGLRTESKEAIAKRATAVIIKEMQYAMASMQRRVESLLGRDDAANLLRELCKKNGHPIARETHKSKDNKSRTKDVTTEYLPAVDTLLAIMDELADQHAKLSTTPK